MGWGRCFDWSGKCRRITSRKPQFCAHNWRAINSQFEVVFCYIRRRIYHRKSARLLIVCHILYKTCYHSVSHHVMFKMTVVYAKTRYKGGNFDDLIRSCLLWTGVVWTADIISLRRNLGSHFRAACQWLFERSKSTVLFRVFSPQLPNTKSGTCWIILCVATSLLNNSARAKFQYIP